MLGSTSILFPNVPKPKSLRLIQTRNGECFQRDFLRSLSNKKECSSTEELHSSIFVRELFCYPTQRNKSLAGFFLGKMKEAKPLFNIRPKQLVWHDPQHGVQPKRDDHQRQPCESGSHACSFSFCWRVETFFSSLYVTYVNSIIQCNQGAKVLILFLFATNYSTLCTQDVREAP